jgi:tetratricopeptide (TPR) repeat protein
VIPRLDVINERHFYLAGVGVFLAAGLEIALLCRRFSIGRKIFPIIAGAVFATLLCFTMLRNNDYRSERALWESTVRFSSHKSRVYNNLGYAYESEGRRLEARTAFAAALKIDPGNKIAQNNMQHIGTYSRECNSPERSHTGGGL